MLREVLLFAVLVDAIGLIRLFVDTGIPDRPWGEVVPVYFRTLGFVGFPLAFLLGSVVQLAFWKRWYRTERNGNQGD